MSGKCILAEDIVLGEYKMLKLLEFLKDRGDFKCKMHLSRLGDYIEETIITNDDLSLSYVDIVGITITKEIIPTKATESENMNLAKYKKVYPFYDDVFNKCFVKI